VSFEGYMEAMVAGEANEGQARHYTTDRSMYEM